MNRSQFIIGLIALLAVSGCQQRAEQPDGVAVILLDASGSCSILREDFLAAIRKRLRGLDGMTVQVQLVTTNNLKLSPIEFTIPRPSGPLSEYADTHERKLDQVINKADADMRSLLAEHDKLLADSLQREKAPRITRDKETDIFLKLASLSVFQHDEFRDKSRLELSIYTDGLNQSPEWDLVAPDLSEASIDKTLARLKELRLVPNLKGVTVKTVAGLAAGKSRQLSATQVRLVELFWEKYFAATGASVNDANIGSEIQG